MYLIELYQQSVPWKWTDFSDPEAKTASFLIDEQEYEVLFQLYDGTTWSVEFQLMDPDATPGFRRGTQQITGTRNAYQVFATVVDIMSDFLKKVQPEHLTLQAEEPSRKRLYDKMANKMVPPGYELETNVAGPFKDYNFIKTE